MFDDEMRDADEVLAEIRKGLIGLRGAPAGMDRVFAELIASRMEELAEIKARDVVRKILRRMTFSEIGE